MLKKIPLLFLLSCIILFIPLLLCSEELVDVKIIKSDTLIGLSKKLLEDPSRWPEIAKVNNLKKPYRIFPGDKLIMPSRLLRPEPYPSTVTFVSGEAMVRAKGESDWRKLSVYEKLTEGSVIRTAGSGSSAELTYSDGTIVYIRPDTTVGIAASGKRGETITERRLIVETGRIITKIKKALGTESRFEIHTPSAVAGVKGTEFRTSVDDQKTTRSEVFEGVVQLSAMNKNTLLSQGEGALVNKGEPPLNAVKLLSSPKPVSLQSIFKSIPFDISFEKIEGADKYFAVIASDMEFKFPLHQAVIKPNEKLNVSGLKDGLYYMRSSSIDAQGLEGMESAPYEVKIRVNPVPPFTQSPADKAEIRSRQKTVEFSWLKVSDAVSYHLQIAEDREFTEVVNDISGIKQPEYMTKPLDYKTYYFRLCSAAQDGYEAAWSDTQSFTVVPPPPAPPVDKPDDTGKEIQIRWQKVQRASQYHFQMAKDSSFKNVLVDKRVVMPSVALEKPTEPGTYFVRTSSIDHKDFEGDFSQPQSFEIKPPAQEKKGMPYELITIIGGALLILLLAL
ncbi:MAG: FecR domain-containing protein [Nitrospirae bacterium]|nr:FecR domain-containing protein [Nitrospirota bacterium]